MYNPAIGKFLSVDPLANKGPWWTPYQFGDNNPIKNIDIMGLWPKDKNLIIAISANYASSMLYSPENTDWTIIEATSTSEALKLMKEKGIISEINNLVIITHGSGESVSYGTMRINQSEYHLGTEILKRYNEGKSFPGFDDDVAALGQIFGALDKNGDCYIAACGAGGKEEFNKELAQFAEKNIPKGGMPWLFLNNSDAIIGSSYPNNEGESTDLWNPYGLIMTGRSFLKESNIYSGFEEILSDFDHKEKSKALDIKLLPKNPEKGSIIQQFYQSRNIKTIKVAPATNSNSKG